MSSNYDDWDVIPMAIGIIVLLIMFGVIYIAIISTIIWLLIAGLAYTFNVSVPPYIEYAIVGYATLDAIWRLYKEVKS